MKPEILNKLKAIERLYLISKEKEEVYTKKNKCFCLLHTLIASGNLKIKNRKFKVNWSTKIYPNDYETKVLELIQEERFLHLDIFINNSLVFNRTLVELGFLKTELKAAKKLFFFNTTRTEFVKTPAYFNAQKYYFEELETNTPLLKLVCEDEKFFNDTKGAYTILKSCVIKANEDEEAKKQKAKESKKDDKPKESLAERVMKTD